MTTMDKELLQTNSVSFCGVAGWKIPQHISPVLLSSNIDSEAINGKTNVPKLLQN